MKNKRLIVLLLGLALMLTVVACGNNETGKKNNDKKAQETVQGETENDAEEEEDIKEDTEKEAGTSEAETPENTQSVSTQSAVTKTTMYAKSNVNVRSGAGTSNSKIGSLTKGQEIAKIGEENGWSKIEYNGGVGYVKTEYLSTEKVEVSTPNNQGSNQTSGNTTTNNSGTNNNTFSNQNQGSNDGGSAMNGLYRVMDSAALERLDKCYEILCKGIASQHVPTKHPGNSVTYWNDKIMICADSTRGSWMYVCVSAWSTDGGSDETAPGYNEIPSLMKQCFEVLAPQGGTELYNKVNALILQYGDPFYVPTQGAVSESIPGLRITIEQGKSGLEIFFWAE